MDETTAELRDAHDTLAELYADRLANALAGMPVERAVLGLFGELLLDSGLGSSVGDIGCGSGRLAPFLADCGLTPHGVDLSPQMIRVARRDFPRFPFDVADLRDLPFADVSLAGVVCWYSLMYLAPADRPRGFGDWPASSRQAAISPQPSRRVTTRSGAAGAPPTSASSSTEPDTRTRATPRYPIPG